MAKFRSLLVLDVSPSVLQAPGALVIDVTCPGIAPCVLVIMASHPAVCALIHSRTAPTFHAVTLTDNLNGLGKVPAATMRQSVGAENGNGAGVVGRLGLWTSCASRMNAPSGIKSNDGITAGDLGCCAGMGAAIADLTALGRIDKVMSSMVFQTRKNS